MTAEELLRMPDDNFTHELVNGELRTKSFAGHQHGKITAIFAWRLAQHVEAEKLGGVYAAGTGFLLWSDPDTVRAPDVAFISRARVEAAGKVEGYWHGAPDLAVEVVSPNDTFTEIEEKALAWLEAGTRAVLVINPRKRAVTVTRSLRDITILTHKDLLQLEDLLPGCSLQVRDLFH